MLIGLIINALIMPAFSSHGLQMRHPSVEHRFLEEE